MKNLVHSAIRTSILAGLCLALSTCGKNDMKMDVFGKSTETANAYGDLYVSKFALDSDPTTDVGIAMAYTSGHTAIAYGTPTAGKFSYIIQTLPDGTTVEMNFNAAGELTTVTASNGERMTFSYSGTNVTVTFIDAAGGAVGTKTFTKSELENATGDLAALLVDWDSFLGTFLTTLKVGLCPASLVKGAFTLGLGFAWALATCPMAVNTVANMIQSGDSIKLSNQLPGKILMKTICSSDEIQAQQESTRTDRITQCVQGVFADKEKGIRVENTATGGTDKLFAYTCSINNIMPGVTVCMEGKTDDKSTATCTDDAGRPGTVDFNNIFCASGAAVMCTQSTTLPDGSPYNILTYYYGNSSSDEIKMLKSLPGCA